MAQIEVNKFDIRFGVGKGSLALEKEKMGMINTSVFESELNYKLNEYLVTAFSVNYGKDISSDIKNPFNFFPKVSYHQENISLYISPFKNIKRNDFRIGTGLTLLNYDFKRRAFVSVAANGEIVDTAINKNTDRILGFNFIIENTYTITDRIMGGLKLSSQTNFSGEYTFGILLKSGIRL